MGVTLNDVEPKVLRRIEVLVDIERDRLHLTLQAALGWTNSHLYEIRARDTGWACRTPSGLADRSMRARPS
jgi:Plasmid pRiA4b ORF-3-like protein